MLETLRKYWIGMLLLLMIAIHASIIGLIRYQASLAKLEASCEVDLGHYLANRSNKLAPLSMRIHAIVPNGHRILGRQLLEQNRFQIRQAIEERIRQLDPKLFDDPYLASLKSQIKEVVAQRAGGSTIEEVVITDLVESREEQPLRFHSVNQSSLEYSTSHTQNSKSTVTPHTDPSVQ